MRHGLAAPGRERQSGLSAVERLDLASCAWCVRSAPSVSKQRQRAIEIGTLTYGSVRSILDNKLDRQPAQRRPANRVPVLHPNIRGPRYYH
jgi:hypothetical protein